MATLAPTKTVYITVDLNSCGNSIAQKLRSFRDNGGFNTTCEAAAELVASLAQYGAVIKAEVLGSDGTAASGTVTWTAAAAHGAGASNRAFAFAAGSAGACTVTVGSITGITITGSGTAATDAAALKAAIDAAFAASTAYTNAQRPTVTVNSGDVRIVWGEKGDIGNAVATVVTASGGGKLTADAATLTGGTPTGDMGNVVVNGHTKALSTAGNGKSAADCASAVLELIRSTAAIALVADSACPSVDGDVVLTLTARVPPSVAEVGNKITLTASVGTASGATLAGGVNSSISKGTL